VGRLPCGVCGGTVEVMFETAPCERRPSHLATGSTRRPRRSRRSFGVRTKRPCAVSSRAQGGRWGGQCMAMLGLFGATGLCWDIVGTSWHAEPCGGQVGPCVCGRYIGACWGEVGVMWGHVEAVLGLFGVKGEPSWSFLRPCCIIALLHRKKTFATFCYYLLH
jgi:hypothetical protein